MNSDGSTAAPVAGDDAVGPRTGRSGVSFRAFIVGLFFAALLSFLDEWLLQQYGVGTLGGIQMPFGAVFLVLALVLFVNKPLQALNRALPATGFIRVFSAVEIMTVYVMVLFGALVSTSGCDNQFMSMGPGLFYFQKPENGWAQLFEKYVPTWFTPGWDGHTVNRDVVQKFYLGGVPFSQISWHLWMSTLIGWSVFLLLTYALLFFVSLLFRKQWIENEALAFPLVQLPLQMVDVDRTAHKGSRADFWKDKTMWLGFLLAAYIHSFNGMNHIIPDWPTFPVNQATGFWISFPDKPWDSMGGISAPIYLGGIGIAYLLNREVALSFWFFYVLQRFAVVGADIIGFPPGSLPLGGLTGSYPNFIAFQSTGGWLALALMLIWTARGHLGAFFKEALKGGRYTGDEPFSPRFAVSGLVLSFAGLMAWSLFAGFDLWVAALFFGIFLITSLVLARLVVEGGLMFVQPSTNALQWMTTGLVGSSAIGPANITKLSFVQPSILLDTRTTLLPAFLHTMKISHELQLDRKSLRRLLLSSAVSIVVCLAVSLVTTLWVTYNKGGLSGYTWPTVGAPQGAFTTAATLIKTKPGVDLGNVIWTIVGGATVILMTMARSRFLWFPFHPLGYIAAATFPVGQLWFSFFIGWLIKSLIVKYGGSDGIAKLRPFMIGLILGNLTAMIFWMLVGFKTGSQIGYWPA